MNTTAVASATNQVCGAPRTRLAVGSDPETWRTRLRASKRPNVLPGFGLSLGYTLAYLGLIVLLPLSAAFVKTAQLTWPAFIEVVTAPRVVASYKLTFGAAFGASVINAVFGLLVAWVLVRYRFPGKRLVDALVDLPFALPTAVAGIALAGLFSPKGWLGAALLPAGHQGRVHAAGRIGCAHFHRTAVRRAHRAAGARATAEGARGSRGHAWRVTLAEFPARHLPDRHTGAADRVCTRVRTRHRRIRFGDIHRRQHADGVRDHAAVDHHQARAVRLRRRDRDRRRDAVDLLRRSCCASTCCKHGAGAVRALRHKRRVDRQHRLTSGPDRAAGTSEPAWLRRAADRRRTDFPDAIPVRAARVCLRPGIREGHRRLSRGDHRRRRAGRDAPDTARRGYRGAAQPGLRGGGGMGHREIPLSRQEHAYHA